LTTSVPLGPGAGGANALVLHPDLVPVEDDHCMVDLAGGATIRLPVGAFDLVRRFVHAADPALVLSELAAARGADHTADHTASARATLAGLIDRGFVVRANTLAGGTEAHGGLFGAPRTTVAQALTMPAPAIVVAGMPYDLGASGRPGTRGAPAAIRRESTDVLTYDAARRTGWFDPVEGRQLLDGIGVSDVGDLVPVVADRNGPAFDRLERTTAAVAAAGLLPVVLGGDHSITLPAVRGVLHGVARRANARHERIGVLHLDAHADIGIDHGPDADWRMMCHHGNVMTWVAAEPGVASLVQVGCRQRTPIEVPTPANVTRLPGIVPAMSVLDALEALDPDLPWYVTLDVDVLDPAFVAGTGTPLPGGYDARRLGELLALVGERHTIVGVDVCELIPERPSEAALVADLLLRLLDHCS